MSEEKVVEKSALKPWLILYAIIFPPLAYFFNNWHQALGRWWLFPAIIPLPVIWLLIIFFVLEKASPRFKINAKEMTLFVIINYMVSGSMYVSYGLHYWTSIPLPTWNYGSFIHGKIVDPYKDVFLQKLPSYLAPSDIDQLNAFYYGGAFNWGVWLPSMLFWMIWAIALYVGSYFWSFPLRKPLVDIERLPFPGIMPTEMIMRYYFEEENGKRGIFNLGKIVTKIFWVGLIFGCITASPIIINAFLPSPWVTYIHNWPVAWTTFTESFLPGANFNGAFYVTDMFVGQFMPTDVLATAVLWWLICGVIYQTIAVRMGLIPWTPGQVMSDPPWSIGPFKWMVFAQYMSIGLGLWVLISHRQHIINVFKAGLGLDKSLPAEEEGVSYRTVVLGGILTFVVLVVLFLAGGTYAPLALIIPLFYILYMFGWTRMMAEAQEFMPSVQTYTGLVFDMGTAFGGWGGRPDPKAFNTVMMYTSLGRGGARMSSLTMHHWFKSYKLGRVFNTRAADILVVSIITMVTTAVAAYLIWPYWYASTGGYSTERAIEYHIWGLGHIWSYTYGTPPAITPAEDWGLMISASIIAILIYIMRARFTWFFINPVGMMVLPHWWWPTWVAAFLLKYISLKIGGARMHERYVLPFSAGYCAGYGAIVIIASFIMFFQISVPELITRIGA